MSRSDAISISLHSIQDLITSIEDNKSESKSIEKLNDLLENTVEIIKNTAEYRDDHDFRMLVQKLDDSRNIHPYFDSGRALISWLQFTLAIPVLYVILNYVYTFHDHVWSFIIIGVYLMATALVIRKEILNNKFKRKGREQLIEVKNAIQYILMYYRR
ncbi:hypothetical protein K6119_14685 [Paracrocinitomix mangrovi]|uniref:hypothetical protein n=1 Tax=Paracrocinitomix mangrovi TaxID=2862509 RepID=UPI001C8CFA9D|nr:hypothetical protein [Paracrocinitomix mangrovi]UKN00979.1 hypothetical protein K6119_14685 [Paracrocinitomix mangrovi]